MEINSPVFIARERVQDIDNEDWDYAEKRDYLGSESCELAKECHQSGTNIAII